MTRVEKSAEAQRLRAEGLLLREIAEAMGAALSTVSTWINDPDGSKLRARKDSYRGSCVDCGKPTSGSNGRDMAPERCHPCTGRHGRRWPEERIVAAIRLFAQRNGRPPHAPDFSPAQARSMGHDWRADHFKACGDYPFTFTVTERFGSWNAAVKAAGFTQTQHGHYERFPGTHRGAHLEAERPA